MPAEAAKLEAQAAEAAALKASAAEAALKGDSGNDDAGDEKPEGGEA